MKQKVLAFYILICILGSPITAELPPIQTVILEPVFTENIQIWVPALKSGPIINRACQPRRDQEFSISLSSSVLHTKSDNCPDEIARILAENVSFYHSPSMPLTIFDGWKWEYIYSLSQFQTVNYELAKRGGSWENSWEAILNISFGESRLKYLDVKSLQEFTIKASESPESFIKVKSFSSMRTRDGYPKNRQF